MSKLTVENAGGTLTTYSYDDDGNTTVVNANGTSGLIVSVQHPSQE